MKIEPFKMKVTPEQSKTVQEVLFANGYKWHNGDTEVNHTNEAFLFYNDYLKLTYDSYGETFIASPEPEITFEQFKSMYMNDTRTFTVQVPEGYEIDKEKSTFEQIVFKAVDKLPRKWEDLKTLNGFFVDTDSDVLEHNTGRHADKDKNVFPTKEYAEAALALAQLLQLRQAWIGEWKPDWKNENEDKYCITRIGDKLEINCMCLAYIIHSFPTKEMANDFLTNFKDLLETAKPLL